jgi:flagellar hook-associated protein 3 FlgL
MSRISTAAMHKVALQGILERNAELIKTQNQIATGKRITNPSDDPSGAVRALDIDRVLAESRQFARNSEVATNRLTYEEQTLADMTSTLQRVRDLTVQGANATVDSTGRAAISEEIQARLNDVISIANRKDANGEYLFAGFQTLTQPFSKSGSTVQYVGDQGVRLVQTSPTQKVADGHSGFEVFLNVSDGNGTFVTGANAANTGSGIIDSGSVTNPSAWVKGSYTLRFTSATAYEVLDSTNAVVTTGTYTSGGAIAFNGIQISLTGNPATNDQFTVDPSTTEDVFTTLQKLITTLARSGVTTADKAQFSTEMGATLTQLDSALDHVSGVRSDVGARLSALQETADSRDDREVDLSKSLSELRDLDYAEAITRLNVQLVGLQAAQSSYTKMAQLSLFDFIR